MTEKGATGDFFFSLLQEKKKSPKMDNIILPKKKHRKIIVAARLATITATRWTGNSLFFGGQPQQGVVMVRGVTMGTGRAGIPGVNECKP